MSLSLAVSKMTSKGLVLEPIKISPTHMVKPASFFKKEEKFDYLSFITFLPGLSSV